MLLTLTLPVCAALILSRQSLLNLGALAAAATLPTTTTTRDVFRAHAKESQDGAAVQITLTELQAAEVSCPANFYLPAKGEWDCLQIRATANNQGKRDVSAAGVFGRIRDADGYPCLSTALDDRMQTTIASLGAVPRGKSDVSFVVAVSKDAPRPLSFEGFKAVYRNAAIERTFAPLDACELDPISCALAD